ncbi:hypothetical protein Q31a_46320 [Aureliella helgolandensis]|uniref:Uncharacterized protein n=1 Tax=Aureliella helgolandensis TaxID=2527968 RepID=A0A518GCH5_9BACT|nr:hypothetical protein Q31a_46320 [Aureliella helgolandensis]
MQRASVLDHAEISLGMPQINWYGKKLLANLEKNFNHPMGTTGQSGTYSSASRLARDEAGNVIECNRLHLTTGGDCHFLGGNQVLCGAQHGGSFCA